MSKLNKVVLKDVVASAKLAVDYANAVNSTKVYKHKEKVSKGLTIASIAIGVLERVL